MKKMSKIFAWLLVMCLLVAMFPAVSAAGESVASAYYGVDLGSGLVGQIVPGTDEGTVLSRLLMPEGAVINDGVKTGSALTLADGSALTLAVLADCNGDGNFSVTDMLMVKSLLLGQGAFSPAQNQAGDVSGDGQVTITDFLQMKRNILGQAALAPHPVAGGVVADTILMVPGQTAEYGSAEQEAIVEGSAITWEAGVITAAALGTARITWGEYSTLVTVCADAPTIAFTKESIAVGPGLTVQLETVTNHPVKQHIAYAVSDPAIATVDENGVLTALAEGTVTVTATLSNGAAAAQTVTVLPLIDSISLSVPYSMKVKIGGTKQIAVSAAPETSPERLIWASSDPNIATVDENGVVTGVNAGNVTITCTSEFGKVQAAVQLKVCNLVQVALTFDDGPSGSITPNVLDLLKKYNVTATFFLVGEMMSYNKGIVTRIGAEGHELGYHSWGHTFLTQMSDQEIKNDFNRFQTLLTQLCGRGATVYRAPGGGISERTLKALNLPHIMWNVDTRDWETRNTDKVCNAILGGLRDGAIILVHDIHATTFTGAQKALDYIFANDVDVEFLTVTQLLSRNGTAPTPGVNYSHG